MLHKNYTQAELDFAKALSLAPDSPTILNSLVELKSYNGDYADAIKYLEKIIDLEPENKEAGLNLFQLYIQEGNNDEAHEILDILFQRHLGDIQLLYAQSNLQYLNHDWHNLLRTYYSIYLADSDNTDILQKIYEIGLATDNERIVIEILMEIQIENKTTQVLELLVNLLSGENEYSEAIFYIQELIEIEENTDQRTINLGELYLLNKQFDHVIQTLIPIFQSGNHSLEVLRLLMIAYSNIGKSEEQIAISFTLTEEYPELTIGYEALVSAYLDIGDEVNALHILHKSIIKFPHEVQFLQTTANIYYHSKNYSMAEKYFMAALDINPQMFSIQHNMGIMFEEMKDTQRSDSLFKNIIIHNENDAVGLNDYAYLISERNNSSPNDLKYALKLAERAIAMEPDNAAFLDTIGWIYFKMDTFQKAEEYLEKSLNINNNNPVILEHLGDIYVKLNKSLEAVSIYEKVLSIDSDNQLVKNKINNINE